MGAGEMPVKVREEWVGQGAGAIEGVGGDIAFVGEVDGGFGEGAGFEQPVAPSFALTAEGATGLDQGLAALSVGFGVDEVGQPFGGGQVNAAVFEGATGELPGFRQAAAGDLGEGSEYGPDDGAAAMDLQFGHVLAGFAGRGGKPED